MLSRMEYRGVALSMGSSDSRDKLQSNRSSRYSRFDRCKPSRRNNGLRVIISIIRHSSSNSNIRYSSSNSRYSSSNSRHNSSR